MYRFEHQNLIKCLHAGQNEIDNEDESDRIVILGPKGAGSGPLGDPAGQGSAVELQQQCEAGTEPRSVDPQAGLDGGNGKRKKDRKTSCSRDVEQPGGLNPGSECEERSKRKKRRNLDAGDLGGNRTKSARECGTESGVDGDTTGGSRKWSKVAKAVLQQAGRGMKLKRLCKKVVQARGKEVSEKLLASVERQLGRDPCFVVSPKGRVTLP
jgi:hypothetical protein